jgi:hypothetical protein
MYMLDTGSGTSTGRFTAWAQLPVTVSPMIGTSLAGTAYPDGNGNVIVSQFSTYFCKQPQTQLVIVRVLVSIFLADVPFCRDKSSIFQMKESSYSLLLNAYFHLAPAVLLIRKEPTLHLATLKRALITARD